jgi:uncharacterized protein YndB with AHSA1/START domain
MIEPVRRSVTVGASQSDAFRTFTRQIGSWWPVETHSMAADRDDGSRVSSIVFEEHEGGRVYEIDDRGAEGTWANVLVWDPPHRVVLAWKPNLRDEPPSEVEIAFTPFEGGTRVDLEHRRWQQLGPRALDASEGYASGWAVVLEERFARAASEGPALDGVSADDAIRKVRSEGRAAGSTRE